LAAVRLGEAAVAAEPVTVSQECNYRVMLLITRIIQAWLCSTPGIKNAGSDFVKLFQDVMGLAFVLAILIISTDKIRARVCRAAKIEPLPAGCYYLQLSFCNLARGFIARIASHTRAIKGVP
jgi:hypothetical protein